MWECNGRFSNYYIKLKIIMTIIIMSMVQVQYSLLSLLENTGQNEGSYKQSQILTKHPPTHTHPQTYTLTHSQTNTHTENGE
ncbi:hypothetical protein AN642_00215 [Epulopiscium sp. SCG-B10WGA-EpuloA2]|nr:hypothetical protein AN642_00215 [Epulopiscium sp. SCG-B10WGA-EpuloA2]